MLGGTVVRFCGTLVLSGMRRARGWTGVVQLLLEPQQRSTTNPKEDSNEEEQEEPMSQT